MRILIIFILSSFLFSSCRNTENKKAYTHNLQKTVSSFFSSEDTLFKILYEEEFLKTLDTFKFVGRDLPIKLSLIEYYGGSSYSVAHTKLLLATYKDVGRIYFFDLNGNNRWKLETFSEIPTKDLDTIESRITNAIKKDQMQLKRDPNEYRVGDIMRYNFRNVNDEKSKFVTTLTKPGYSFFNLLVDITPSN